MGTGKIRYTAVLTVIFMVLLQTGVNGASVFVSDYEKDGGGYAAAGELGDAGVLAKLYDASNGLPTSDANCVLGTRDGYVYIGGYSGVIRYDGTTFERMSAESGLTNARTLFEDSKGRLWAGTNDNGVVVLDGTQRRHYTYEDGLTSSSVRAFAEDKDENIYIGSTDGIACVDREGLLKKLEDERVDHETIVRLSADANGRIYGNTYNGDVFAIENGTLTAYYSGEALGVSQVSTVYADPEEAGKIYIGTGDGTVYYGNFGEDAAHMKAYSADALDEIYYITTGCKKIWVTSENAAGYLDEEGGIRLLDHIPMKNSIDMVTQDYQGNLWFASSRQGVMKIVTSNFRDITEEAGLSTESVNATCLYEDMLYIGTDAGLYILDRDLNICQNELTEYLKGVRIRCLTDDEEGKLWISTYTDDLGLLCLTPGGEIRGFTTQDGMPDNRVRCTVIASDKTVLVGTNGGLAVLLDGKIIRTVTASETVSNTVFLTLCEGDDGIVYAGTDGDGIYAIQGEKVEKITRADGLTSDVILRIKRDDERGVYWIITSNSIEYMKDGLITNVDSFPYNNTFDIFSDDKDNLWILSSMGVYCLSAEDVLNNTVSDFRLYTLENGLPGAPTNNSYSALTKEGTLYMTERTGVCEVNINRFFEQKALVKTGVRSITCDDSEIEADAEGVYTIPADTGRVRITPAILDYTLTNPLVHVYLSGTDEAGITAEQSKLTALEYTGLPYGTYTLHIQLLNKTTKEVLQDDTLRIVRTPKLTELWIVRVLLLGFLILVSGFTVWRFMRATVIARQKEELKRAKEAAERAIRANAGFFTGMSQELMAPINIITGTNEIAMRESAKDVPKEYLAFLTDCAETVQVAAKLLLVEAGGLLYRYLWTAGSLRITEQEYDTGEELSAIISIIDTGCRQKGIVFDVHTDDLLPRRLYGDKEILRHIVLVLLFRALQHTLEGSIGFRISMEERNGETAVLTINIRGAGISEEEFKELKKLAETAAGTLLSEHDPQGVVTFVLKISQKIMDATPVPEFTEKRTFPEAGTYIPRFIAPDADILIAAGDGATAGMIRGLLRVTEVFVTVSADGEDVLNRIRENSFNIVFIDQSLKGMDHKEIIQRIRAFDPNLPVYAITSEYEAGEAYYLEIGYNGFLLKPVDGEILETTVLRHLPEQMTQRPGEEVC